MQTSTSTLASQGERALFPFTASDGENLALYAWRPADPTRETPRAAPRGLVLLVHGLGEHAGRYDHVAQYLRE